MWYVISSRIDKFYMAAERKYSSGETEIYYCWIPTAKDGDQTKNPSTFDHVNLKVAYATLNSDR